MLRAILLNRYTITFGLIAILAVVWNIYVHFNDDGIITGQVIGPGRRPVPGATVILSEKTLLVSAPRDETRTDAAGRFRFSGHRLFRFYLEASKEGVGRMPPKEFRLYFKGQNLRLDQALQLKEGK